MAIRIQTAVDFSVAGVELTVLEPAVTQWQRLETEPSAPDLAPGLEARIADPLWLVGRQWQLAELKGEDAGTPVRVVLEGESAPIGFPVSSGRASHPLAGVDGLIEPLVEAEGARDHRPSLAAEAGADFARALALHGASDLVPAFVAGFPFSAPTGFDASRDRAGARFLTLSALRAIDGRALAATLQTLRGSNGLVAALPPEVIVPAASVAAALAAANDWLALWDMLILEPPAGSMWRDSRLEYTFSLNAKHSTGTTSLVANEYHGGRLDWWSFDVGATAPSIEAFTGQPVEVVTLPTPIRYPGMPADRYWEFEDGSVNLAQPKGGPTSIALMLVLEYELVASNNWFQVPLELPYGSSFRVSSLKVTDTFGRIALIPRASAGPSGWGLFELTPAGDATQAMPLFILPQVTANVFESEPLEEILLFRDEMANLVWGVEKRVAGCTTQSVDPAWRNASRTPLHQQPEDLGELDAAMLYRLQSTVPANWFPFVAEADPAGPIGSVVLSRRNLRRLAALSDGSVADEVCKPLGRILLGSEDRFVVEEREVPRSGLALTRTFQHARTSDGRRVVWLGRHKRVGRGEGSSELRHDILESVRQGI